MFKKWNSKLSLAVMLPLVQFPIAVTIVMWNHVLSDRGPAFSVFYRPVLTSICRAMNAPAWIVGGLIAESFRFLMTSVVPLRPTWSSPSFYGVPFGEVSFLICVLVLWFLVGRALDDRRISGILTRRTKVAGVFMGVFFVLLGAALTIAAVNWIRDLLTPTNFLGTKPFLYFGVTTEILLLAWSFLLILFPGRRLIGAIRQQTIKSQRVRIN